tara:strand:+ start:485 stop:1507 length:1023 start_codon:yes stop_codon:yes gene_type:complete
MNIKTDVIVGLQHGDEGKGKITHILLKQNKYDLCIRYNGGPNAGHTIYHNNKKIVLHQIPCGILHGIKSIIGPGCVIDIDKLEEEIKMLEESGIENVRHNLKIAFNAHVITDENIKNDKNNNKVGTTCSGIGPTYVNKYNRCGKRISKYLREIYDLNLDVIDTIEYIHINNEFKNIFFEGAQGYELDIDWGDYPYVTSSNCLSGNSFTCGVPPNTVNKIYGVCKLYETYVGSKNFEKKDIIFDKLRELGHEYGATTGRNRQCNWLNIDRLIKALLCNGVNELIINKCDIIKELNVFKLIYEKNIIEFSSFEEMKGFIVNSLRKILGNELNIIFSESPNKI